MFKKFSIKQLSIGLAALCALYLISFAFGGKGQTNFSKNLTSLDTATVKTLIISPAKEESDITLTKSPTGWQVSDAKGLTAPAQGVKDALAAIQNLNATQLVATSKEKWAEYKVDDENATRVQVTGAGENTTDLMVGKFEYKQSGMSTYVRKNGENNVYLVNGFLDATFNKPANDWRNKTLIAGNQAEWLTVTFIYPADSSFQLVKGADQMWRLSDSTGLDNGKVAGYLNDLASLAGMEFVETKPTNSSPLMKIDIATTNQGNISLIGVQLPEGTLAISSNQNGGAWFKAEAGGIGEKAFKGMGYFLKME